MKGKIILYDLKFRLRRKVTACNGRNKDSKGGDSKRCTLATNSKSPAFRGLNSGRYGCYSCTVSVFTSAPVGTGNNVAVGNKF